MNRIMSGLLATALSASFAVAEIVPVNAQPTYVPLGQNVSSDVQTVDHRRWRRSFNRVNQNRRVYRGDSHVEWCYSRYRSYRAYDNTYQPYYGPRRQCISPY
ncbi:MAG: BA14K family protein [Mesorhizobium sp.]|nr:MAG: BA14K family protein [Mesorhizobium sp.]